jgi:serine/threonine protein kinase
MNTLPTKSSTLNLVDIFKIKKKIFIYNTSSILLVENKFNKKKYVQKCIQYVTLDEIQLKRITREVNALLDLRHENIIGLHSCYLCQDTKLFSLYFEFAGNGDLFNVINNLVRSKTKRFTYDYVKKLILQLTNAIKFIHDNGYIHRDIKPENILITNDDNVKLCDFGFAIKKSEINTDTNILGTCSYIAPEIFEKKKYSEASDIWALGCTIHIIITFRVIFNIKTNEEAIKVVSNPDNYPKLNKKFVSDNYDFELLSKIINGIIVFKPEDRLTSTQILELIEDVSNIEI